jgi:hypothetical protein
MSQTRRLGHNVESNIVFAEKPAYMIGNDGGLNKMRGPLRTQACWLALSRSSLLGTILD